MTNRKSLYRAVKWALTRPMGHVLAALLCAVSLLGILGTATLVRPILRDIVVAQVAYWRTGTETAYPMGEPAVETDKLSLVWDTQTNAPYFVARSYNIIPFFAMENLTGQGIYPKAVIIAPYVDYRSFVVAGNAGSEVVYLNERYVEDQADALATLTHELIHIQGGFFLEAPQGVSGLERSYFIESRTQSATLEVLAAMCRMGDDVACSSFWAEVESFAVRSLKAKALRINVPWLYEMWADVLLRDDLARRRAEKMDRFWSQARLEQRQIIERYGEIPWNQQVIPGICGEPLQTGLYRYLGWPEDHPAKLVLAMPFDDTRAELGWFLTQFICGNR